MRIAILTLLLPTAALAQELPRPQQIVQQQLELRIANEMKAAIACEIEKDSLQPKPKPDEHPAQ